MAVLVIAGLVLITSYGDYGTTRSRVVELVNAAGVCKTYVTDFYLEHKRMPADAAQAKCEASEGASSSGAPRVKDGVITVSAAGKLKAELEDRGSGIELRYTPGCAGGPCSGAPIDSWDCRTGTTIQPRYLPSVCR